MNKERMDKLKKVKKQWEESPKQGGDKACSFLVPPGGLRDVDGVLLAEIGDAIVVLVNNHFSEEKFADAVIYQEYDGLGKVIFLNNYAFLMIHGVIAIKVNPEDMINKSLIPPAHYLLGD